MVGQERQHPALIWREAYDVLALPGGPTAYWELANENDERFFAGTHYATITRINGKRWMLERFSGPDPVTTYHRTLKEAKALGLVEARFNIAQRQK